MATIPTNPSTTAEPWNQDAADYRADRLDAPVPTRTRLGTETILIADDDNDVRQALTRALRRYGFRVLEASTGADAVRLAVSEQGPIDLVLADVVMPSMTTDDLQVQLAKARPKAVVAFMSGYIRDESVRSSVLHGPVPFLPKPFTIVDLVRSIRTLLDERRN